MHVKGHFATVPGQEPGTEQQVFMALCSPLITPDIKESLIQNNTMVFKSVHQLDMNFIELTENGEYHLGVKNEEICSKSWYSYLHPEDIYEAREKHVQCKIFFLTSEIFSVSIIAFLCFMLVCSFDKNNTSEFLLQ